MRGLLLFSLFSVSLSSPLDVHTDAGLLAIFTKPEY